MSSSTTPDKQAIAREEVAAGNLAYVKYLGVRLNLHHDGEQWIVQLVSHMPFVRCPDYGRSTGRVPAMAKAFENADSIPGFWESVFMTEEEWRKTFGVQPTAQHPQ